jgi:hypothetical protein
MWAVWHLSMTSNGMTHTSKGDSVKENDSPPLVYCEFVERHAPGAAAAESAAALLAAKHVRCLHGML